MVSSRIPPHDLQLVIDFVNTLNVERGRDRISAPAGLMQWLDESGLAGAETPVLRAAHVADAIALREALREVLHAHNHGSHDPAAGAELERAAERGRLSVSFGQDGSTRIAPRAPGFPGVLARLLVPVAHAALDGTWQRVKACAAEDCQEAFYDQSRNHSGRWCDMAVCGNRTKVRSYRSRQTGRPR